MKEFLDNREDFLIERRVDLTSDLYNSRDRLESIFDILKNRSVEIDSSIEFLEENIDDVELAIRNISKSLKDKISHITTSVVHIGKLKLSYPAISKEGDIKLVDLTSGSYNDMAYSHTDSGLIMETVNITTFMEQ
ncbi:MAG: hypothetical protein DRQ78_00755 [Epsilonproteobacteria bacterium]|nr:MAG: hypothetical protein DRQ78_00755 [Campylobacterota bacterium]